MSCTRDFAVFFSSMMLLIVASVHGSEIIGGKEVEPHSLPFMALLQRTAPICGGILIDPSWVLTAAHCKEVKTVLLGVHSIKADESDSRQVLEVKKQFPHPKYDNVTKVNDLMLLKLCRPAKQTNSVKCHKLQKTISDPAAGSRCTVAGWGKINYTAKKMSDVLRSVDVKVIDRATCNSPNYYNRNPTITRDMICAGSDSTKEADTCKGDSGGPLLCNGVLVGVTSFGKKCGDIMKPGVYAFLSKDQLKWIKKTMKSKI